MKCNETKIDNNETRLYAITPNSTSKTPSVIYLVYDDEFCVIAVEYGAFAVNYGVKAVVFGATEFGLGAYIDFLV